MKKSSKKKLVILLYILVIFIPFLYTFRYILNNRPSQLEKDFEERLSDIFDIPVEAVKLRVEGPRHYLINELQFRTGPKAKPFLVGKNVVFVSEDEGGTYSFRLQSCQADLRSEQDLKVIFGSLERIVKKQATGRFPDLVISFARSDISFAIRGGTLSVRNASGEFSIRKGEEGVVTLTSAAPAGAPLTLKGAFGWDRRFLEVSSAELPFPAADFIKRIFGTGAAVPESFNGKIVRELSPGKSVFMVSGETSIDASKYFTEKFIGRAKGMVKVKINSWQLHQDDSDFDVTLEHESTPESNLILYDYFVKKVVYLLTRTVPREVSDKEVPEEVGIQIVKQGRNAKFKGTRGFNSTWIKLSDPPRSLKIETSISLDVLKQRFLEIQEKGLPEREPPNPLKQLLDFVRGE